MPAVIANYPNRQQSDVDGYIAVVDCRRMGNHYVLQLDGQTYLVAVADCAQVRDVAHIEYAPGGRWIADVDETTIWGDFTYHKRGDVMAGTRWQAHQRQKGEGTVSIEQGAISLAVNNSLYAYGMAYKCQHEVDKLRALDTRQETWKFIFGGLLKNG